MYAIAPGVATRSCRLASVFIVSLAFSACATATVVPLEGPTASLAALAGEWTGAYSSPDVSREGTIWFTLVEGEDHAHGEARMVPRGADKPYRSEHPQALMRDPVQFLGIRFVRVSGATVLGVLDQYWDPDAGCFANTNFQGRILGDRIEGTFETRLQTGVVASGRWHAARERRR